MPAKKQPTTRSKKPASRRAGDGKTAKPSGAVVRDHRTSGKPGSKSSPVVRDHRKGAIEHVFVLMLENRSFDHMLGFAGITGTDAETGKPTTINGLKGNESNVHNGKTYTVQRGARDSMPNDPGHEFGDVLTQLCGVGAKYPSGGKYPAIHNSGYAAAYVKSADDVHNPGEVMRCYMPEQLPVLTALAKEFVLCDNWHASLPGPTWPNRMFALAATSGGLEHSPSSEQIIEWETEWHGGFEFKHGSLIDLLRKKHVGVRLYAGDHFPMVAGLKNVSIIDDIREFEDFSSDLKQRKFDANFIFIEPSYDVLNHYKDGTSQHPQGNVHRGEALIKSTYEAIRNSPVWQHSMLIITWDEHGGFYDHAVPPATVAPGDTAPHSKYNQTGFTFEQLGPRVPALVISPLVPRNLIDHRLYDHSTIPATVERIFHLPPLTKRDAAANSLEKLPTAGRPRPDAPAKLPSPPATAMARVMTTTRVDAKEIANPQEPVNQGNLPVILHAAMRQDIMASPPQQREAILQRVQSIKTRGEALQYMQDVESKVAPKRMAASAR